MAFSVKLSILLYQRPRLRNQTVLQIILLRFNINFCSLSKDIFLFPHSGMCQNDTVFEKSPFCWLINILCHKWMLWRWHGMLGYSLSEVDSCDGEWEEVGAEVLLLLSPSLHTPPQLFSSSGFSVEHLALRRSCGWGSVTFDEWILLWLTPLLSGCLILMLYVFPPSLVYSLSLNDFLASAPRSRQWLQI